MFNTVRIIEPEPYGKKIGYDPLWTGPMYKERHPTNVRFFRCFIFFCIIWLSIAIYTYSSINMRFIPIFFHNTTSIYNRNIESSWQNLFNIPHCFSYLMILPISTIITNNNESESNNVFKIFCIILQLTVIPVMLCTAFILLIKWFVKYIVYIFMIATLTIIVSEASYSATLASRDMEYLYIIRFITSSLIFVVLFILFIMHRKKINISSEVIREAAMCITFFPKTFLFPLLSFFLVLGIFMTTVIIHISLLSIAKEYHETPNHILIFFVYNVFGFFWLGSFILSFSQMVLSGTFATWYWTSNKIQVPSNALLCFADTTIKNHLGTLAFGSIISTICQLIKFLLKILKMFRQERCNRFACCFFGWYEFVFGNVERFVKYINFNAYIICAIHGTGFVESAKYAFNLLMRNIVKTLLIKKITDIIVTLAQIFTVCLSVLITAYYWNSINTTEFRSVLALTCFISTIVSFIFFMVLRTAINTIYLCVLEDYEQNDGTNQKPYYMSLKLKNLFCER